MSFDFFPISGVVLVDQLKSLDWKIRKAEFIDKLDVKTMGVILGLLGKVMEF